ncbi:MAG TPA: hypothetical protein DHH42_06495 [Clostridiales bacterium]|nr:hypothetical protein [Clostridiales bacterium]
MKLPNKITSYKESVIGKLYLVLSLLMSQDMNAYMLYKETIDSFTTTAEFIDTLDCLFALGAITLLERDGAEVLHYAL